MCYPSWYGAPTDDGGTQSARLSARRPAVQTWTKELRSLMVPTSDSLYHMDMTAFELRIAAALSRDRKMYDFAFSPDPYSSLGSNRSISKIALLVGVNGGGVDKAWRTAIATSANLITKDEIAELPVFTQWTDYKNTRTMWYQAGTQGNLYLDHAGIAYMHSAAKTMHDTTSFMVQGHAAVFMSMLQTNMSLLLDRCQMSLQLHDELVFQTSTQKDEVHHTIQRCIFDTCQEMFGRDIPFTFKLSDPYTAAE
jgi:DNA polymerase I-like protein with 3'-5' exonuclease and polymerase domains